MRLDGRQRLRIGDGGADLDPTVVDRDPLQLGDLADGDDGTQAAELLGDPQPHIGPAGQDRGAGMFLQQRRQRVGGARCEIAPPVGLQASHRSVIQGLERGDCLFFPARESVGLMHRLHRLGGGGDRAIAGAAAEIAGERIVDPVAVRLARLLVEREQRHHEARRAEAALRAMAIDHRLLAGMQRAVGRGQILHRQQLLAVQRADELDAGIDRAIAQAVAVQLAQHHGAGAAIALAAAFLGADAALRAAQIVQHGRVGIDAAELAPLVAQKKPHRSALLGHRQLPR